jgi:hypothetical protein
MLETKWKVDIGLRIIFLREEEGSEEHLGISDFEKERKNVRDFKENNKITPFKCLSICMKVQIATFFEEEIDMNMLYKMKFS